MTVSQLQYANAQAQIFVSKLPRLVKKQLQDTSGDIGDFFCSGLDKYCLTVIEDKDNEGKDEKDYETILPLSYYLAEIKSVKDVVPHYLHVMGHKKCNEFWRKCPVPRQNFSQNKINYIEEIYNQRLFDCISPDANRSFYKAFASYQEHCAFAYKDKRMRELLNSMLTHNPDRSLPYYMIELHWNLYNLNPFEQSTFNFFIDKFLKLLLYSETIRQGIEEY